MRCGTAGAATGEAVIERYQRDRSLVSEVRLANRETIVSSANERGLPPGSRYPAAALTAEVPLQLHGKLVGSLNVLRLSGAPFATAELALLEGMALQAALALDGQRIAGQLEASFLATIDALVRALEAQDMYTSGHALSIADLARHVGRVLGLDAAALRDVEHAAVLHDIGKIGIPSELLRKTGPLSSGEREHMRAHPEIGARILDRSSACGNWRHSSVSHTSAGTAAATPTASRASRFRSALASSQCAMRSTPWSRIAPTAVAAAPPTHLPSCMRTPARNSTPRSSRPSRRRCATAARPRPLASAPSPPYALFQSPAGRRGLEQESGATGAGIRSHRCLHRWLRHARKERGKTRRPGVKMASNP